MTYRNLLNKLLALTNKQLNMDVTINIYDEFYPVAKLIINDVDDILDKTHPYLSVNVDD